jgi:hypothetical protein
VNKFTFVTQNRWKELRLLNLKRFILKIKKNQEKYKCEISKVLKTVMQCCGAGATSFVEPVLQRNAAPTPNLMYNLVCEI